MKTKNLFQFKSTCYLGEEKRAVFVYMFLTAIKNNCHIYKAKTWSFFYKYDQLFTFMDLLKCCT